MTSILNALRWIVGEVWEKINLPAVYRELKRLGKKHGRRFFWAAIIWEIIEDVFFPFLSWWFGVPELIPLFLIFHFEPIAYPAIFWGFRMYDRFRGREPWEPDRSAHSSYWRSVGKVAVYKIAITGWFVAILLGFGISPLILGVYVGLMGFFGFIYERIWNDSNYGILPDDTVQFRRVAVKTLAYRLVSTMTMYPLLKATLGTVPWVAILSCQCVGLILYIALETIWAKSGWGVITTEEV
jgi:hypothetical protein